MSDLKTTNGIESEAVQADSMEAFLKQHEGLIIREVTDGYGDRWFPVEVREYIRVIHRAIDSMRAQQSAVYQRYEFPGWTPAFVGPDPSPTAEEILRDAFPELPSFDINLMLDTCREFIEYGGPARIIPGTDCAADDEPYYMILFSALAGYSYTGFAGRYGDELIAAYFAMNWVYTPDKVMDKLIPEYIACRDRDRACAEEQERAADGN